MNDREIDEILKRAAEARHDVDPALLDRVSRSIGASLRPVRPLPPAWILSAGLVLIGVVVAAAGAVRAGLDGIHKLSAWDRAVIFPLLAILFGLAAVTYVSEKIPGSRRLLSPGSLLWAGSLSLLAIFAVLFHDYRTDHFVHQGLVCLSAGLLHAVPAALAGWWLLRRGFAVHPVSAGLVAGLLAGLAGITMLELHCANFQALHVMLWHTAVMPLSGAAGALLALIRSR